jgi:hypothetical protein
VDAKPNTVEVLEDTDVSEEEVKAKEIAQSPASGQGFPWPLTGDCARLHEPGDDMTATKKLYRVEVERSTPQDRDRGQVHVEVLYCGYDVDDARRVYHANKPSDYHRGGYTGLYQKTRCRSLTIAD